MEESNLPRIIHAIWAGGTKPLPPEGINNLAKWALYNPSFTVTLWVDTKQPLQDLNKLQREYAETITTEYNRIYREIYKMDPDVPPNIQIRDIREEGICQEKDDLVDYCLDRVTQNYGMSSDILRYRILYKHGGVYVDVTDVYSTPTMKVLDMIPGWDEHNPHTLYIDHLSQHRNPSAQALVEFKIPTISDLTGPELEFALAQTKIGNDTFVCTKRNPLMLMMSQIAESGFEVRSHEEMIKMVNNLHNVSDSTIATTGPEVPQKAICLATTGKLTPGTGGSVKKHLQNEVVLIKPVRCTKYQLTMPVKNTRSWNNVSIDTSVISNQQIAFEKITRMIRFEITHMSILRLDDHLRELRHVANKLKLSPEQICRDFIQYLDAQALALSNVQVVQNVEGNLLTQEFYRKHNLVPCDLLMRTLDEHKAYEYYQDICCYRLFRQTPMFKRLDEVNTTIFNQYQLPGEQRALFDKIHRAVSFIHYVKNHPQLMPTFHSLLVLNQNIDLTLNFGAIMNKFTDAFLEPNKEISKSQIGDVLIKLHQMKVENSLIKEYLQIKQTVDAHAGGDVNKCLRVLANNNKVAEIKVLLKYFDVDINAQALTDGRTALHWAACKSHNDVVKLLLDNGADKMKTDKKGQIPGDIAHETCQDLLPKTVQDVFEKK